MHASIHSSIHSFIYPRRNNYLSLADCFYEFIIFPSESLHFLCQSCLIEVDVEKLPMYHKSKHKPKQIIYPLRNYCACYVRFVHVQSQSEHKATWHATMYTAWPAISKVQHKYLQQANKWLIQLLSISQHTILFKDLNIQEKATTIEPTLTILCTEYTNTGIWVRTNLSSLTGCWLYNGIECSRGTRKPVVVSAVPLEVVCPHMYGYIHDYRQT